MNVRERCKKTIIAAACMAMVMGMQGLAQAEDTTVAILNMQQVVAQSNAGRKAQDEIEKKVNQLQSSFQKDEDDLRKIQEEFEKKSSAWSETVKQEKAIEIQKKRRDLRLKQDDANMEIKKMREQYLNPILKDLEQVVHDYAVKHGYKVVLPRATVLFADPAIDITKPITEALNKQK